MTENEKVRELIATSETTVKVDPQNGWYLKRFAALQFEGSVDNFERDTDRSTAAVLLGRIQENYQVGLRQISQEIATHVVASESRIVPHPRCS